MCLWNEVKSYAAFTEKKSNFLAIHYIPVVMKI